MEPSHQLSSPVSGIKLSSVVPARLTGDNKPHNLTAIDLAMKLHYIRAVYFFTNRAVQGLTSYDLKKPMFHLLEIFNKAAGRVRMSDETGRPYIRCNDSGVRFVEALVEDYTVDEWLAMDNRSMDHQHLVYDHVLGPDLGFSPLVFFQVTRFKCGGISIGLSWSHVLGDAFAASAFLNMFGRILAGRGTSDPLPAIIPPNPDKPSFSRRIRGKSTPARKVDPVSDRWLTASNHRMGLHSFCVSTKQLDRLVGVTRKKISCFEILSSTIWVSMFRIRRYSGGPKTVTICARSGDRIPSNLDMEISTVEADVTSENEQTIAELATLIAERRVIENGAIEGLVEADGGISDFIVYGANLTFVDLEKADVYGFAVKGEKAVFANYTMHGVGEEGVVLVYPGPEKDDEVARTVTIVLPEDQLRELKDELKNCFEIV